MYDGNKQIFVVFFTTYLSGLFFLYSFKVFFLLLAYWLLWTHSLGHIYSLQFQWSCIN